MPPKKSAKKKETKSTGVFVVDLSPLDLSEEQLLSIESSIQAAVVGQLATFSLGAGASNIGVGGGGPPMGWFAEKI
jgi:hypothetical protein